MTGRTALQAAWLCAQAPGHRAADAAVEQVRSGMVLGLRSGTTVAYALQRLAELLRAGKIDNVCGVPSSIQTEMQAQQLGIPLTRLDRRPILDLTIDGADEVDPDLNLIKGGGGALLREKVLAQASRRTVFIVDANESHCSKLQGIKAV